MFVLINIMPQMLQLQHKVWRIHLTGTECHENRLCVFCCNTESTNPSNRVCVHLLLTHGQCGGQLRPNRGDLQCKVKGSYHYTQTVRRLKSLTGGNWIQVVTHSTRWSCSDGGLRTRHTHDHTRGESGEGTDLNPSDTVYPTDKPPPGVWLIWISNNLPLKHRNDMK